MKRWIAILWMAAAGFASAADKLVGGPYVVNVGPKTATVGWVVETDEVSLGTSPESAEKTAPVLRGERVSFTGLQPGKRYYYSVPGQQATGSFKTPPAAGTPFEFVVFGDTRTRHDVHRNVIDAILKYASPDFVLHTGDLVADGADSAQWPVFFDIERGLLKKAAFFPALGNHERNNRQFYDFFAVGEPYYSFNWGDAHFTILNSDIGNAAKSVEARDAFWTEQTKWLEEDLKGSQKSDFRFVVAHHPPITAVERRQGDNPQMIALMPLLEKYKVTAGFFGHDHNYQHYLKNGIHYFITGGGGAPLYDVNKPPEGITKKVVSKENFVVVKIDSKGAHVVATGLDGEAIEVIDLAK